MNQHKERVPLLELVNVTRLFSTNERAITILNRINLKVYAGEMIAIIGASGSGKSTLMNVLGCLDHPTSGEYRIGGEATGNLEVDALAHLRRERFGFIFQRYHLLPYLCVQENVEMPAVYAGMDSTERAARAQALLKKLGMANHAQHRPHQLSGGQQQRVSIARALMNGGEIILADEPTGALDSKSGHAVMHILRELHANGHTVILVTHNEHIAAEAPRIIEIRDGEIVRDEVNKQAPTLAASKPDPLNHLPRHRRPLIDWGRLIQAGKMAWVSLYSHRLRTALTLLGIIIGIASVVSTTAIGEGAKSAVLKDIASLGTNMINIYRGKGWGDRQAGRIRTLQKGDMDALNAQAFIDSVTPNINRSALVRYRDTDAMATIRGVGEAYFQVSDLKIAQGTPLLARDIQYQAQNIVIDANTRRTFFGAMPNPIGQILLINNLPSRVIGVAKPKKDNAFSGEGELNIWMPYTTVSTKLLGQYYFNSISVRVRDGQPSQAAERSITALLKKRHGTQDFFTYNMDTVVKTTEKIRRSLTLLLTVIATISLVVGGIGVMNIMLVSVTERTREIGIRMAVGARRIDILRQFLIEAVTVCLMGGVIGILLSFGIGKIVPLWVPQWKMVFSMNAIILAFVFSALIGILFGFMPAHNASRLNPAEALSRD